MPGEYLDLAALLSVSDSEAAAVASGVALRLAEHHGARITTFERSPGNELDGLNDFEGPSYLPYAGVEFVA